MRMYGGHDEARGRLSGALILACFCSFIITNAVNAFGTALDTDSSYVFTVAQIYNSDPFDSAAEIVINIKSECQATITICTPMDDVVRRWDAQVMKPGQHIIRWDGRNNSGQKVASGVYFFKIETQHCQRVETLAFLR